MSTMNSRQLFVDILEKFIDARLSNHSYFFSVEGIFSALGLPANRVRTLRGKQCSVLYFHQLGNI